MASTGPQEALRIRNRIVVKKEVPNAKEGKCEDRRTVLAIRLYMFLDLTFSKSSSRVRVKMPDNFVRGDSPRGVHDQSKSVESLDGGTKEMMYVYTPAAEPIHRNRFRPRAGIADVADSSASARWAEFARNCSHTA